MRPTRLLLLTAAALSAVELIRHWAQTPELMASHFGASGRPDAYLPRSGFFSVQAAATVLVCVLGGGIGSLVARVPTRYVNLPHKALWLAPERRVHTLARLSAFFETFGTATLLLVLLAFELALAANRRPDRQFDVATFWPALLIYLGFVMGWVGSLLRAFSRPPGQDG